MTPKFDQGQWITPIWEDWGSLKIGEPYKIVGIFDGHYKVISNQRNFLIPVSEEKEFILSDGKSIILKESKNLGDNLLSYINLINKLTLVDFNWENIKNFQEQKKLAECLLSQLKKRGFYD